MKFTYTKFGILKEVQTSPPYWHIVNEEGSKVSINYRQYARGQGFLDKLNELVGHPVVYRTTRRDESRGETGEWPSDHWFSDVFLDDGLSHNWPKEGDKETVQTIVELRLEMKRAAKRAERELKDAQEQRDFDQKQTEGMLKFESDIEAMPYNDYVAKMNTDEIFRGIYEQYVKWKSDRLRTDQERRIKERVSSEKVEPTQRKTIAEKYEWHYIGKIGTFESDPEGNLKVWGEEYGQWYHFAFPDHVFFRTLQLAKLPTLQKHNVWALIDDDNEFDPTTYIDMTVRHFHDEEIDVPMDPYQTLHQTELLPHLIEKINDNAAMMEQQASGYGDVLFELDMAKPSDEELLYFYQTEIRPHERRAMGLEAALAPRLEHDPEFAKKYRFYQEKLKETDEAGVAFFTDITPIEDFESYKWIELPAPFNVSERAKNPHAPFTLGNTPVAPLQVYYEVGDVRVWTFDGGPPLRQPENSQRFSMNHDFRGETMRRKLGKLDKMPIYLLVNEKTMTFLDVTLANGDLDQLELMQCYGEEEHWLRLERKIERFAIDKSQEAADFESKYNEALDELDQYPPNEQFMIEYETEQIGVQWAKLTAGVGKEGLYPLKVIGMALFASNAKEGQRVNHDHVTTSLAVRCGIDISKTSNVNADIWDRTQKQGKDHLNCVEATINGQDVTLAIGISTSDSYKGYWIIRTCFSGSKRHEKALKRLGYRPHHRNDQTKDIPWFLDLFRKANLMAHNDKHPYWTDTPKLK